MYRTFLRSIWCRRRALYIIPELTSITRNAAALDVPVFVQMQVMRYFVPFRGNNRTQGTKRAMKSLIPDS